MKNYIPSKKAPFSGLVLGFFAVVLGGILIGVIGFAVSQFVNFIVVFPLAMSLAGAMVIRSAISKGKIRNSTIAIIFGLCIGIMIYGTYQYSSYVSSRNELVRYIQKEYNVEEAQALESVNAFLIEETGARGFWGLLKLTAKDGINLIGHLMFGGTYIPLPGVILKSFWAWLYWLVELALTCSLPVFLIHERKDAPFCEKHQTWYGNSIQVGNIDPKKVNLFITFLNKDLVADAGELIIEGEQLTHPTVEVYLQKCSPKAASDILLTIKQTFRNSRGKLKRKLIQQYEFSAEQFSEISSYFGKSE